MMFAKKKSPAMQRQETRPREPEGPPGPGHPSPPPPVRRARAGPGPGAGVAAGAPAANGLGDSWQRGANNLHDFIFWWIRKGQDLRCPCSLVFTELQGSSL